MKPITTIAFFAITSITVSCSAIVNPVNGVNDDVYGKLDWSVPVETNLLTLYKQRAEQLREKYDYLVMYYSGGADSTNALHAFIDNNIFLDELIMHMPEPVQKTINGVDTSNLNYYSEVEYAAVAHLKKFKNLI